MSEPEVHVVHLPGGNFYNMVFGGACPEANIVLRMLIWRKIDGIPEDFSIPRLRDAWIEKHGEDLLIRVHARIGGGNRRDYASEIRSIRAHPWYVRDADMEFDDTYADFYFRVDIAAIAADDSEAAQCVMDIARDPIDMPARWQEAIAKIGET